MNIEQTLIDMMADIDLAIRNGEAERTIDYMTDDVVHMPPDQPLIIGKEAVRVWQRESFEGFDFDLTHNITETVDCGDVVVLRGTITGTITPKEGGESMKINNKNLQIYRKEPNGKLLCWRTTFNSNDPANGT